jgi:hypothetical protein
MDRIKVVSVTPLTDMRLLVVFNNSVVKLFNVRQIIPKYPEYEDLENEDIFSQVEVEPGGYGVYWTSELDASEGELWREGVELPLDADDMKAFVRSNVINTTEVTEILHCSRQNVDDLVRRKKLKPIKSFPKGNLFLKSDVIQRVNIGGF